MRPGAWIGSLCRTLAARGAALPGGMAETAKRQAARAAVDGHVQVSAPGGTRTRAPPLLADLRLSDPWPSVHPASNMHCFSLGLRRGKPAQSGGACGVRPGESPEPGCVCGQAVASRNICCFSALQTSVSEGVQLTAAQELVSGNIASNSSFSSVSCVSGCWPSSQKTPRTHPHALASLLMHACWGSFYPASTWRSQLEFGAPWC